MPAILYGAPSPDDDDVEPVAVVKDGEVTDVLGCPGDEAKPVELWMPSSEKRRLEERIEELEKRLLRHKNEESEGVNWKVEYLILRHRAENPHLYDSKGCPTPEAVDKEEPKGGLIYGVPLGNALPEHFENRRVVTMRERLLELASAFYHRGNDERLSDGARAAWKRAYVDLIVLRHHGMDRPDLLLCLKCGGTGDVFPTDLEWIETGKGNPHHEMRDGKPMVQVAKKCSCEGGFDPNGDIDEVIDD